MFKRLVVVIFKCIKKAKALKNYLYGFFKNACPHPFRGNLTKSFLIIANGKKTVIKFRYICFNKPWCVVLSCIGSHLVAKNIEKTS
jgi:hypothetical protein